jgi:hypothetical protein
MMGRAILGFCILYFFLKYVYKNLLSKNYNVPFVNCNDQIFEFENDPQRFVAQLWVWIVAPATFRTGSFHLIIPGFCMTLDVVYLNFLEISALHHPGSAYVFFPFFFYCFCLKCQFSFLSLYLKVTCLHRLHLFRLASNMTSLLALV